MFYSSTDGQYIQEGTQFELGGITYPAQWLYQSTSEQKTAIGLEEVIATNSPANDQYYWVSEDLNGPVLTYINTPKDLEGVKQNQITSTRAAAYSLLLPSDWMVVKSIETGTPVSPEWTAWRESIRVEADDAIVAIGQASDVGTVESIVNSIVWPASPVSE